MPDIDRAIREGLDAWDRDDLDRLTSLLLAEAASDTSTTTTTGHRRLGRVRPGAQDLAQSVPRVVLMNLRCQTTCWSAFMSGYTPRPPTTDSSWPVDPPVSIGVALPMAALASES
jgi:hypothetical protein